MIEQRQLHSYRVIPVVVLDDADDAGPLADALVGGGLPVAEVTLRTSAGLDSLRRMARRDDILVGAGTVTTAEQVDAVADAGAAFVVSPGTSEAVVRRCQERDIRVVPGAVTPTEVMRALDLGVDLLKFFPAGNYGGVKTLKALGGPFRDVRFIPTGGVSIENIGDYLSLPNVVAVGGSWMVSEKLIRARRFDEIRNLSSAAVDAARAAGKEQ